MRFLIALLLAALAGFIGWRAGALTRSGILGATIIGAMVLGFGGLTWAGVLLAFFLSSSVLTRLLMKRLTAPNQEMAKTGARDWVQTMANGGVAAGFALVVGIVTRDSPWYPTLTLAYLGALSAATADTWATEIGGLDPKPRLITTGEPVPAGRSGGVSLLGTLASVGGGLFLGVSAFVLIQGASLITSGQWYLQDWFLLPICTLSGLAGSLADSLLGARWQRLNYCVSCGTITERKRHACGQPTQYRRGLRWLDNDLVNLAATLVGSLTAVLLSIPFLH